MADQSIFAALRRASAPTQRKGAPLRGVDDSRGWRTIHEYDTGAWQRDDSIDVDTVLSNWTVWSCMSLIASDVAKCGLRVLEKLNGVWEESASRQPAILRKPNHFQTRQQFLESWIFSKLATGNTFVLKERDGRGAVSGLYILDPSRVTPIISEGGLIYYRLARDQVNAVPMDEPAVPSDEILHDRYNCQDHPLIGISPLTACGLAAMQGTAIAKNSAKFFGNMSRPSGILTAPGAISTETADRLKKNWEKNYAGANVGKIAVLGDDLKYQAMGITAVDSQMVEQMKLTAEMICSVFHVPAFKVGAGTIPSGQKVEDLTQIYFSDCLDGLMDAISTLLTGGLGYDGVTEAVHFNLDDLLRMDSRTLAEVEGIKTQRGISSPNEARRKFNLPPVKGGESPYLQQQEFSLEALAKRDALADPFGATPAKAPPPDDAEKRWEDFEHRFALMEERAGDLEHRGVWKADEIYRKGNLVTDRGSLWSCKMATTYRPGEAPECWVLVAKRGHHDG